MRRSAMLVGMCVVIGGSGLAGCVQSTPVTELDESQQQAVAAAMSAMEGLASASQAAQTATEGEDLLSASAIRAQSTDGFTFGTCPEIGISGSDGEGTPNVTINFGDGCSPAWATGLSCAGSMAGTLNFTARSISLTFSGFTCGDTSVTGSMEFTWLRGEGSVALTGDTDLTIVAADDSTTAYDGSGSLTYASAAMTTTIVAYGGTLTQDADTWTLAIAAAPISYQTNGNYVPSAGTATISAPNLGDNTVVMTFDENSPTTGVVQVSVNGGPQFEWTLAGF